ncbi:hypothetical protein BH09DEP1_BH09DEP1_7530 [soil metagenome]
MKIIKILGLLFTPLLLFSMEQPPRLKRAADDILVSAINNYQTPYYLKSKNSQELQQIIKLAYKALKNVPYRENLAKKIVIPAQYKNAYYPLIDTLSDLINKASKIKEVPATVTAPRRIIIKQKPKPQTNAQPNTKHIPLPARKKAAAPMRSVLDTNLPLLHRFLDAEINNDRAYLSSRQMATYHVAINSANNVYNDASEILQLQMRYKLTKEQVKILLNCVIRSGYDGIIAFSLDAEKA